MLNKGKPLCVPLGRVANLHFERSEAGLQRSTHQYPRRMRAMLTAPPIQPHMDKAVVTIEKQVPILSIVDVL